MRAVPASRGRASLYAVVAAGGCSLLGNAVAGIVLPWYVLTLTESALWTGVAAAMSLAPLVLGAFFGGTFVDRLGSRRVAIAADCISAISIAAIPLLHFMGLLNLGSLLTLIVAGALLDGPGLIAQEASYPVMARGAGITLEELTTVDELIDSGAAVLGPPLAGATIAVAGVEQALLLTAGLSLAAAALNAVGLPRRRSRDQGREAAARAGQLVGLGFVVADPLLRTLLILVVPALAALGAFEAVVMPVQFRREGGGAGDLGLFLACISAGSVVGAVLFATRKKRSGQRWLVVAGLAGLAAIMAVVWLDPPRVWLLVAAVGAGVLIGPLSPLMATAFLRRIPSDIRGRALGASTAIALAATPLAMFAAGVLLEIAGIRMLLAVLVLMLIGLAVLAACRPELRALDQPQSYPLRTERDGCVRPSLEAGKPERSPGLLPLDVNNG